MKILGTRVPAKRQSTKAPPPATCLCDYCKRDLPFWASKDDRGLRIVIVGDRIIGRSATGGFICRQCYENPHRTEQDYRDVVIEESSKWFSVQRVAKDIALRRSGGAEGRELIGYALQTLGVHRNEPEASWDCRGDEISPAPLHTYASRARQGGHDV